MAHPLTVDEAKANFRLASLRLEEATFGLVRRRPMRALALAAAAGLLASKVPALARGIFAGMGKCVCL